MKPRLTRKEFIRAAAAGCAGLAFPRVLPAATLGLGGATAPNSRVQLGFIGVGGRGGRHLTSLLHDFPGVECAAVADVKLDGRQRGQRIARLPDSAVHTDLRDLLARGGLDAVVISTPDHWHVPAALACIRRGLGVYVEKPMCRFLAEGRLFADTVAALGAKVLVGSQQRSIYPTILRTVRAVQAGRLGDLKTVRVLLGRGNPGVPFRIEPIPPTIDYPLWLGPAPDKPYCTLRVGGTFREISDYSEGSISDWGAHHLDTVQMALGTDYTGPSEVEGSGLFPVAGLYDVPYEYNARLYYPAKKVTVAVTTDRMEFPEVAGEAGGLVNGIRFEGSEGSIFCDREKALASSPALLEPDPLESGSNERDGHDQNFLNMLTAGAKPVAPAEIGHRSATLCHLIYAAVRLRAHLKWNPDTEQCEGDNAEIGNRALRLPRKAQWYSL